MNDSTPVNSTAQYLAQVTRQRVVVEAGPWDHQRRRISFSQLLKRLSGERDALLACQADKPVPAIHLIIAGDSEHPALPQTRESWLLQSHPRTSLALTGSGQIPDDRALTRMRSELGQSVHADDLVVVARPGDLFHPAMATALALRDVSASHKPLAWTWNRVTRAGKSAIPVRLPGRAPLTLLGADYVGGAVAFRARVIEAAPPEPVRAFMAGDPSLLLLSVAAQTPIDWAHHPEKLSATTTNSTPIRYWGGGRQGPFSVAASEPIAQSRLAALKTLAVSLGDGRWQENPDPGTTRPPLEPADSESGVSVVIPFRDHIEQTIKAVRAVASQQSLSAIEVILINNRSQSESIRQLEEGLQSFTESVQIRVIDYPAGFSHSRQCNLGVEQALHDTVVILNNDAYLQGRNVLSELVRWAGVSGVATVGVRIVDEAGRLVCGGLRARVRAGLDFQSCVEESRDPLLSEGLREVFGNTGACFAIRRDRFLALGGFDGINFPIGLNDVDFCLRAIRSGLTHINLGWLTVCHKPGTSRGVSDELYQRLLLRERYPEVARLAQFQLGLDDQPWDDWSSVGRIERLVLSTLRRLRAGLGK